MFRKKYTPTTTKKKKKYYHEGLEAALERLKLQLSATPSSITGNRPYAENSRRVNRKHCRLLEYICFLTGDYEGAIILQPNPPANICPSISARTIILAIKFKRGRKGIPLQDENENDVLDVLGRAILCQGGWNDPSQVNQFLSTVSAIHAARGHPKGKEYTESCDDCVEEDRRGNYAGCRAHRGNIRLWRQGNPRNCEAVKNAFSQSSKDGSDYVAFGDSPLLPYELLDYRNALVGLNSDYDFMLNNLTLFTTKLGAREDETTGFDIRKIHLDLSVIETNGDHVTVHGLCCEIQVSRYSGIAPC